MNNIVLWYDNLYKNNCSYAENVVYPTRTICEKLTKNNIEFSIKHIGDHVEPTDLNVYVIELLDVYSCTNIISFISDTAKTLLRQDLKLILYYPREGHPFDEWLFKIYQDLKEYDLIKSKIFLVYGDVDVEESYSKYIRSKNIENFLTPIAFDFFKGDYYEKSKLFNESLDTERNFDYLFYNGKLRPHRLYAVAELKQRQILNSGLVSLTATTHTGESYTVDDCLKLLDKYNCCHSYIKKFAKDWSPLILDELPNDFSQETVYKNNITHYSSTFFSVISETSLMTRFITEKIYKPIANLHPFVLIGPPNILSLLRSKGFKTFPEMFDESYDNELDPVKRVLMVLDEIEKFVRLSYKEKQEKFNSVKNTLLFNKSFYLKNAKETAAEDFIKMFETVSK